MEIQNHPFYANRASNSNFTSQMKLDFALAKKESLDKKKHWLLDSSRFDKMAQNNKVYEDNEEESAL